MHIKDIENELGITKSNIRFYEKQGLLSPERSANGYREYTVEDLELLKKIVVYRKLGISVENIRLILDGTLDLQSAVEQAICSLEEEVEKLNGSIELCKEVQKRDDTDDTFNQDYYLDLIKNDERRGKKFVDTIRDYAEFEKQIFLLSFQPYGVLNRIFDMEKFNKKHGWFWTAVLILAICTVSGLLGRFVFPFGFVAGFFMPFGLFVLLTLLMLPYYIFKDKNEKAVKIWLYGVLVVFGIFTLACIGVVIYLFFEILKDVSVYTGYE